MQTDSDSLTRGSLLTRNIVWNLAGVLIPLIAAVFAVPLLSSQLGLDRFGLLALAWTLIGYFNVFDLGFGRAITHHLSQQLAQKKTAGAKTMVRTALISVLALAAMAASLLVVLAPLLAQRALNLPDDLRNEAQLVFQILAGAILLVAPGAVLRGVLESHQRFDLVNLIRTTSGLYMFLSPIALLLVTENTAVLVATIAAGKIFGTLAALRFASRKLGFAAFGLEWSWKDLRILLAYGGWIALGNLLAPLMMHADQFIIGIRLAVSEVGYYAVPFEVLTKVWLIVAAIMAVLFPALSAHYATAPPRGGRLVRIALIACSLAALPPMLLAVSLSEVALSLWLGEAFAQQSSPLVALMALAVLINGFSIVSLAAIQAGGRPDLIPKIFLLELPIYLPLLWFCIGQYGLMGAVCAWLAKVIVDALFLFAVLHRMHRAPALFRLPLTAAVLLLVVSAASLMQIPVSLQLILATLFSVMLGLLAWASLEEQDRHYLKALLSSVAVKKA